MATMVWDPVARRYKPVAGATAAPIGAQVGGNPFATAGPRTDTLPQVGGLGAGGDIYNQAWGIINPQLQAAADAINRRSQIGSAAISDLTNVYSQRMAAASGMNVFGPEKAPLRAAANWGQSNLVGAGKEQAASLGAALAQAGPGITGGSDINLQQQGKGAGGAAYGTGISWLDAQVAKQSAAQIRAALEPSFAAGMGQMEQGNLARQLAVALSNQQAQITGQIPELVSNLQERQYQHEQDLRDYQEKVREFNVGQKQDRLTQMMGLKDRAEASTGYQYVITPTGIKPRLVNGQKVRTVSAQTDVRKNQIDILLATGLDAQGNLTPAAKKQLAAWGYPTGGGISAKTATTGMTTAASMAKADQQFQANMAKLKVAWANAKTAQDRARISQQQADERTRHNKWIESHKDAQPIGAPTGNRPRVNKAGVWTTADGKVLNPAGQRWWQHQMNIGKTDGRGGLGPVNKKGGMGTTRIRKKATTPA